MKWCMRMNTLLFLIIIISTLCSCENHYDDIKKRFESYSVDDNVVAVLDDCVFYFTDHTLDLSDLVSDDEGLNKGYLFSDKTLYFSTTKQTGPFEFSVCVYTCDLYGNEKSLVFEKNGYKTHPWAVGKQGALYFEYYNNNAFDETSRVIDSYDVLTEVYKFEDAGKDSSLPRDRTNELLADFQVDITGVVERTTEEFREALIGLDYHCSAWKVESDRLFLICRIEESAGGQYPYFICEYVPETEEIHFKSLVLMRNIEPIDVVCI